MPLIDRCRRTPRHVGSGNGLEAADREIASHGT
jgi:hypothetical protein